MKQYYNNQHKLRVEKMKRELLAGSPGATEDASKLSALPLPGPVVGATKSKDRYPGLDLGRGPQKLQRPQAWLSLFYKDRLKPRMPELYAAYCNMEKALGRTPQILLNFARILAAAELKSASAEDLEQVDRLISEGRDIIPIELTEGAGALLSEEDRQRYFRNYRTQL